MSHHWRATTTMEAKYYSQADRKYSNFSGGHATTVHETCKFDVPRLKMSTMGLHTRADIFTLEHQIGNHSHSLLWIICMYVLISPVTNYYLVFTRKRLHTRDLAAPSIAASRWSDIDLCVIFQVLATKNITICTRKLANCRLFLDQTRRRTTEQRMIKKVFITTLRSAQFNNTMAMLQEKQGVALTGRNKTGPPCSHRAIIRLEAAWRHRLTVGEAACRLAVECYRPRQTTTTDISNRY